MTKKLDLRKQITMIRKVSLVVYVALAAAAWLLMKGDASQQFRWFYQTRDALASQDGTVLTAGSHLIVDMPYRVALLVVLLLSAVLSVLMMSVFKKQYDAQVANKLVPLRWVSIAIPAALIMEIVGMVQGVQDVAVLKVMAAAIILTALLSGIAERDNKSGANPTWKVFILSVLSGALPWLIIASTVLGTAVYGGVQLPWYAYALDAVVLVGFSAIAANQYLSIKRHKQWKDFLFVERNYHLIGLALKVAFAAVLIAAFNR
jgi:hypothetical protein